VLVRHVSQFVVSHAVPAGTLHTWKRGLQFAVLQSPSTKHACPSAASGAQPVPGMQRSGDEQPQTSQWTELAWLHACGTPFSQTYSWETLPVQVCRHAIPLGPGAHEEPGGHAPALHDSEQ
jgi:hypothetical protein